LSDLKDFFGFSCFFNRIFIKEFYLRFDVIEPVELDGRTHERGLRENIPEVFPHEDVYIGFTGYLTKVSSEIDSDEVNVYTRFAERTDDVREAFTHFFDDIDKTLFTLDNGDIEAAEKHVSEARESYLEAYKAVERLYEDPILGDIDGLDKPIEYIKEVKKGLESVEDEFQGREVSVGYRPQKSGEAI